MKDRVSIDLKDGVADVRLIRADKMNALDPAMFEGIIEAGDELATMKGLRCVVLSGEGKAFCAGLDMASFAAMKQDGDAVPGVRDLTKRTHGIANRPQQCAWQWRELPVPVIAAVHGVAFGGGFQIALGADMRYATADTRFSVMEIKWGLVPDLAGTQLMRHLAREDVVRELTYTGRIFNGTEAQQARLRDPGRRRSARRGVRDRAGDRRQEPRRHPRRQAAAQRRRRGRRRGGPDGRVGRAAEADRLAQPARGDHVEPAEARRQLQGLTP